VATIVRGSSRRSRASTIDVQTMSAGVAQMVVLFEVDDYGAWRQRFDSDAVGRELAATGHSILRNVDNPKEVLLVIEFSSEADAEALLGRLAASLPPPKEENMVLRVPPTIFELADSQS
jgi:hypothetical protein